MEDLSLAYILGRRRVQGRHGPQVDKGWMPLMKSSNVEEGMENVINNENKELFFRVITP